MTRGYELCKELIADGVPFSALFACNDDMALGASKALHRAGLKIPQDISLFGFDDAPSAKWLEPALSSVYLPIDNMIITAIDQAIRLAKTSRSMRSRRLPARWYYAIRSLPGRTLLR